MGDGRSRIREAAGDQSTAGPRPRQPLRIEDGHAIVFVREGEGVAARRVDVLGSSAAGSLVRAGEGVALSEGVEVAADASAVTPSEGGS